MSAKKWWQRSEVTNGHENLRWIPTRVRWGSSIVRMRRRKWLGGENQLFGYM